MGLRLGSVGYRSFDCLASIYPLSVGLHLSSGITRRPIMDVRLNAQAGEHFRRTANKHEHLFGVTDERTRTPPFKGCSVVRSRCLLFYDPYLTSPESNYLIAD